MDTDLAFCLGRFIDDQVQLIDDRLDVIKKEQSVKCREIEAEKVAFERTKPPPKNNGSHAEDKKLIDQFIEELRDSTVAGSSTRTVIDDQTCIDTLRAEISTKVNACTNYINRLRNLAKPMPNTTKFVETCNETMEHFRRPQEFEENFKILYSILEQSDESTIVDDIHKWWKDKYGSTIIDLNRRNQRFNAAVTENNFAVISSSNRIFTYAKRLIEARKVEVVEVKPPRINFIRKFVQQLLLTDEERRSKTNADELIDQLNSRETEQIVDYAQKWLQERDAVRNHKEEDPFEHKIEDVKADYGRRRIAQEAKKLALAALLCRLAVGSSNGDQFDKQLKNTVNKQKKSDDEGLPIISGDIREPEAEELPIVIQFEVNTTDMDDWAANKNTIRERFAAGLCEAFMIPEKNIRVDDVDRDKAVVFLRVLPPYGKDVVDSLNGTALDAAARMRAVRKCCVDLNLHVESVTLGEFGLKIEDKLMDPRWNKTYSWSKGDPNDGHFWVTPIDQGGKPYFCPSGWKRFGIKVAEDEKEFDARWGTWYVAYHGTRSENASKILTSGLRVSSNGCFFEVGVPRVYVSPSIEYCAHPRYAYPWRQAKKNGEVCWYQLVFQCRVNPASIATFGPETLIPDASKTIVKVDPNFDNGELEWVIIGQKDEEFITKDIVCYGLMMRISSADPDTLPACAWWKQSLYADMYKK